MPAASSGDISTGWGAGGSDKQGEGRQKEEQAGDLGGFQPKEHGAYVISPEKFQKEPEQGVEHHVQAAGLAFFGTGGLEQQQDGKECDVLWNHLRSV